MKKVVVLEMVLLWLGNLASYKGKQDVTWGNAIVKEGIPNAVPIGMLAFILLVMADMGYENWAAFLGLIIVFSYLAVASTVFEDAVNTILGSVGYKTVVSTIESPVTHTGTSSDR